MRTYKNLLPVLLHDENGSYKQGETFQKELTADEELENVNSGLLGIVPQTYRVVGVSRVHDTEPGEEFEAALLLGNEEALIEGGNIQRVEAEEKPPKKPAPGKKKGAK